MTQHADPGVSQRGEPRVSDEEARKYLRNTGFIEGRACADLLDARADNARLREQLEAATDLLRYMRQHVEYSQQAHDFWHDIEGRIDRLLNQTPTDE